MLVWFLVAVFAENDNADLEDERSLPHVKATDVIGDDKTCNPGSENALRNLHFIEWVLAGNSILHQGIRWPFKNPNLTTGGVSQWEGVVLTSEVPKGAILSRAHKKTFLGVSPATKAKFKGVDWSGAQLDPNTSPSALRLRLQDIMLAMELMKEKLLGEESFWAPYIDILPELDQMTQVETFSEDQLEEFHHTSVVLAARQNKEKFSKVTRFMVEHRLLEKDSVDLFRWAYLIVRTRAIQKREKGSGAFVDEMILVPFIDSIRIDARDAANVNVVFDEDSLILFSTRAIGEQEEAVMSFGQYANIYYLMNLGTVPESNMDEAFLIKLAGFIRDDPLKIEKEAVWKSISTNSGPDPYLLFFDIRGVNNKLLPFFRLLFAESEDDVTPQVFDAPFRGEMESMALAACARQIENDVGADFLKKLDADRKSLERTDIKWTKEKLMALKYRSYRKEILGRNQCYYKMMYLRQVAEIDLDSKKDLEEYYTAYDQISKESLEACFGPDWDPEVRD